MRALPIFTKPKLYSDGTVRTDRNHLIKCSCQGDLDKYCKACDWWDWYQDNKLKRGTINGTVR